VANRLWFVSELYYPEEVSTGYYVTKTAEGLAVDRPVEAICAQPTYAARGTRAPRNEVHRNVRIHRCRTTTLDKDNSLFRLVNLLTVTVSFFVEILARVRRREIVLVATNPPTVPLLALIASRLRGARCVLMMQDVYPEALVAGGWMPAESLPVRLLRRVQRTMYHSMDRIVVLGRDMKDLVSSNMTRHRDRIRIIPNWADLEEIRPAAREDNTLLRDLRLLDRFVLQYSGNMGRTHDLEHLVEAARRLGDRAHFLFIGAGARKRWLESTVNAEKLGNVTILPLAPRSELNTSLNACDAAIVSFQPGMSGVSVPSRMYNVMAAGKPILAMADRDSELARVLQEEAVGRVVLPGDIDGLVGAIEELRNDPAERTRMGERARSAVERNYSYENTLSQYRGLIRELDALAT
jgi:glycosyltransferase involved in cell wall biosynthesis